MKKKIAKKRKPVTKLSKEKEQLLTKILKYCEGVVKKYYLTYRNAFTDDAVSFADLSQESKIICLKLFKEYHKYHDINGFDLQKFIARAIGWKMRDLMRCALTETKLHSKFKVEDINDILEEEPDKYNLEEVMLSSYNIYDHISKDLTSGFNVDDILSKFTENDLTILQDVIKYKNNKADVRNITKKERARIFNKNIKPKVIELIKNAYKETHGTD